MAKMTNEHVLLTDSRQHYIALLQHRFGHQYDLKQRWHNVMKCRASHDEHFDISHARNRAICMEIWHVKHGTRMQILRGLSRFFKKIT